MAPRGLKKIIKDTIRAKLVGKGKWKAFQAISNGVPSGHKLRGLTKALESNSWSSGALPRIATQSKVQRGGWKGRGGGRRRGAAVDAQLTRAVNSGKIQPSDGQYNLTKLALAALARHGLEPVACQRAVCSPRHRIGTAIDLLAYEKQSAKLVVVELKCGHSGSKTAAARKGGENCHMQPPLSRALDSTLNRHLAQLAVTRELLVREANTLGKLQAIGVEGIDAVLLYVDDANTTLYRCPNWWTSRALRILDAI
jgi:hypothetical protein